MILINKPAKIPEILSIRGKATNKSNCNRYTKDQEAYENRTKDFKYTIQKSIYGGNTVKSVLKKTQFQKCCFCEKKQGDEHGAVEHYRPKAGYRLAGKKAQLIKPGYYWLGYDWDNLFFVCGPCNTKKGNIFPLKDEAKRATNHKKSMNLEVPYILNPSGAEDPRDHVIFKNNLIDIEKLSLFGKHTVEICDLDRDGLNNERAKTINNIDARLVIISSSYDVNTIKEAEDYIKQAISEQGEFSAMAQAYLIAKGVVLY